MLKESKTDLDILDAKIMGIDLDKEYPCIKCIHYKPCEEAYDMDLGDNYQYCPHYDDGIGKKIKLVDNFSCGIEGIIKKAHQEGDIIVIDEFEFTGVSAEEVKKHE